MRGLWKASHLGIIGGWRRMQSRAVHKMQCCTKCTVVVQVLGSARNAVLWFRFWAVHEMQCCGFRFWAVHEMQYSGTGFGQCTKCSVVVSGFRQCTKCSIVVQVLGSARNAVSWFRFWACTKCSVVVQVLGSARNAVLWFQVSGSAPNAVLWFRFWAVHEIQCCGSGFGQCMKCSVVVQALDRWTHTQGLTNCRNMKSCLCMHCCEGVECGSRLSEDSQ
jgi:hypothetical protein